MESPFHRQTRSKSWPWQKALVHTVTYNTSVLWALGRSILVTVFLDTDVSELPKFRYIWTSEVQIHLNFRRKQSKISNITFAILPFLIKMLQKKVNCHPASRYNYLDVSRVLWGLLLWWSVLHTTHSSVLNTSNVNPNKNGRPRVFVCIILS